MTTEQEVKATLERARKYVEGTKRFTRDAAFWQSAALINDLVQLVESLGDKSIARTGEPLGERSEVAEARIEELRERFGCLRAIASTTVNALQETSEAAMIAKLTYDMDSMHYCWQEGKDLWRDIESALREDMGAAPITRESNPAQQDEDQKATGTPDQSPMTNPAVAGPPAVKEAQWVSVPLEPTQEMAEAAHRGFSWPQDFGADYQQKCYDETKRIYRAMLAAALHRDKPQPHEEG